MNDTTNGNLVMRWILVAVTMGVVGCDRTTSIPVGGEEPSTVPSGLDTLFEAGRSLAFLPDQWLPGSLVLDPAKWQLAAIESPLIDLLGPGRMEGAEYVVGQENSSTSPNGATGYSTMEYRFDTSWATRTLSDTNASSADRLRAIPDLLLRSLTCIQSGSLYRQTRWEKFQVEDADGDGWLRSAPNGGIPRVRFQGKNTSGGPPYGYANREFVVGSGPDGRYDRSLDNPLFSLMHVQAASGIPYDSVAFRSIDTLAGSVWNAKNATGVLDRRSADYLLTTSMTFGDAPAFRDLRCSWMNGADSLWTTSTPQGEGSLHWIRGVGRTDTARIHLVGKDWFRLPTGERHAYFSRPMADGTWSREDLDWTESVPDGGSSARHGTYRFRRWKSTGGGVWSEGSWNIDQQGQRSFTTKTSGSL